MTQPDGPLSLCVTAADFTEGPTDLFCSPAAEKGAGAL